MYLYTAPAAKVVRPLMGARLLWGPAYGAVGCHVGTVKRLYSDAVAPVGERDVHGQLLTPLDPKLVNSAELYALSLVSKKRVPEGLLEDMKQKIEQLDEPAKLELYTIMENAVENEFEDRLFAAANDNGYTAKNWTVALDEIIRLVAAHSILSVRLHAEDTFLYEKPSICLALLRIRAKIFLARPRDELATHLNWVIFATYIIFLILLCAIQRRRNHYGRGALFIEDFVRDRERRDYNPGRLLLLAEKPGGTLQYADDCYLLMPHTPNDSSPLAWVSWWHAMPDTRVHPADDHILSNHFAQEGHINERLAISENQDLFSPYLEEAGVEPGIDLDAEAVHDERFMMRVSAKQISNFTPEQAAAQMEWDGQSLGRKAVITLRDTWRECRGPVEEESTVPENSNSL